MTVGLFDRRKMLRDALKLAFQSYEDLNVVCETGSMSKTLGCIQKTRPDTVIIDPALYKNQLYRSIQTIRKINPMTKFVLLNSSDDKHYDSPRDVTVLKANDGFSQIMNAVRDG